jgi:site-specific recombinase XerD
MRRESVATLRVRNLDRRWGLRNMPVKGDKTRDIPLPNAVMQHLDRYVTQYLPTEVDDVKPDTPLLWSTFGQRRQGLVRRPMEGKNVWRLCKTYGRLISYPMLKPHDLRHGVAMEVYEQHGDLEQVRGLLGHARIETTQLYAQIRPAALKQAVEFYEAKGARRPEPLAREKMRFVFESGRRRDSNMQPSNINNNNLVAPTGHARTHIIQVRDFIAR